MISQDAQYHSKCLVALYNKSERFTNDTCIEKNEKELQGIALAELVAYIEDTRSESGVVKSPLKLATLAEMYKSRLIQLGVDITGRIHTTELKKRIMSHFPDMRDIRQGRDIILAFDEDIGNALKHVYQYSFDEEAINMWY